jgi:putative tricarboxylic transport membrane protein
MFGVYWIPPRSRGMTGAFDGTSVVTFGEQQETSHRSFWRMLARKNVLAGLLFIAVAALGLWLSRDYPIGTTLRMGTGYVPRLLCWLLLGLGTIVLVQGLREAQDARPLSSRDVSALRPVIFVTASLVIFGLSIERLGLVISILLLIGVGAVAARALRPLETLAAALVLIALSWGIFILGLGLTIPVWPEW